MPIVKGGLIRKAVQGGIVGLVCLALLRFGRTLPSPDLVDLACVPALVLALFAGAVPGLAAAGLVLVVSLASVALGSGFVQVGAPAVAGFAAALVAVAARKGVFADGPAPAVPAALTAVVAEVCSLSCLLLLGYTDMASVADMYMSELIRVSAVAAGIAAAASFAFRAPQAFVPNVSAAGVILALVAVVFAVWFGQERAAVANAVKTAESFETDAIVSVDYPIEPELLHEAQRLVDRWGSADAPGDADLEAAAKDLGYELVAAVGADGVVRASNVAGTIGFDVKGDETLKDLDALNHGERYGTVEFHLPAPPMDVAGSNWVKFAAIAFPKGGYALIGRSYADIGKHEYLFESSMLDWHIGKSGYMLITDPARDRIVAGFSKEDTGRKISESGLDDLTETGVEGLLSGAVFGVPSFVHPVPLELVDGYQGLIVMPLADVMGTRDAATLIVLIVCTLMIAGASLVVAKIVGQGRNIAELRRREDERRQKDMDLAKSIQTSSLVKTFPTGVFASMRAAREVGGDFYDCFEIAPGRIALVIADVSGKGVPASLFMMRARTEIRAAFEVTDDLSALVATVNERLCADNVAEMFVTAWIGIYEAESGMVRWTSAGHNPPYVVRANGSVEPLAGRRSLVLAGLNGARYSVETLTLAKDDMLFLYTDGVTEAQSAAGTFFGEKRLESVLKDRTGDVVADCRRVFRAVDEFAAGAPQADDITVLVLRRS